MFKTVVNAQVKIIYWSRQQISSVKIRCCTTKIKSSNKGTFSAYYGWHLIARSHATVEKWAAAKVYTVSSLVLTLYGFAFCRTAGVQPNGRICSRRLTSVRISNEWVFGFVCSVIGDNTLKCCCYCCCHFLENRSVCFLAHIDNTSYEREFNV